MSEKNIPQSLIELESVNDFVRRHIGPGAVQVQQMLDELGIDSLKTLIEQTVPKNLLTSEPLHLEVPVGENETISYIRRMRERNQVFTSMIGMGYHATILPGVIRRNIFEDPGWYTAYTPYQAEISQGRLEALLVFQEMLIDLTGMELANASLLDEGTAAAEAMAMAKRVSKAKSNKFLVSDDCHPQTIAVVKTRAGTLGFNVVVGDLEKLSDEEDEFFGILIQYPGSSGRLSDIGSMIESAHARKAIVTVATDPLSLCLIKPPGEFGADIVVGNTQRFGVPMAYGGPHAAFLATRHQYRRTIPGRLIGVSIDSRGKPALRMALQTREQHIRRDKATSNICTAQVLLAIVAAFYVMYHGPQGLRDIAARVNRFAQITAEGLRRLGYDIVHDAYFDTLTVNAHGQARRIAARAREIRINLRVVDADHLGIALDETTKRVHLERLWSIFDTNANSKISIDEIDAEVNGCIPSNLSRTSAYLTHPTFSLYQSETLMLRYIRQLGQKDIALNRSMIPLGSCTMKLNSTTEMTPVTFHKFSAIHPFAPLDQTQGYHQLVEELETMLCEITGFDAISFQPNAGSQGEYAGLLCIKRYLENSGQGHRNICLIPESAHGTNPASAALAGLRVVVVKCDDTGNVDVNDLKARLEKHAEEVAALMITYPSTHGVFEEAIVDICDLMHQFGAQVYLDGANMNAMVGICKPADFGADVCHLNLHKTFCIPHGGGGPGMGPIGVKAHLAPFLPDHEVVEGVNPYAGKEPTIGTIASAPWGSAGILPISWAYISLMGADGLRYATEVAILNANYMAKKLEPYYPILYKGRNGRVAHECIVDMREIRRTSGVTVEDVAKRLMDYGFHAPTISFPVADTMMIEPTESEAKREIDRFCDALVAIRQEIADVESGKLDPENNPLKNAPHTFDKLISDEWDLPYSREQAFFPLDWVWQDKYWPPVGRIDNVYGDRHVVCSCPPMSEWMDSADAEPVELDKAS
ncbi:MAG: aminomethyl-transferring glycine dehydrogenase [Gammaproteobacteria bacterium]|nr:aminomethyl-transferring glycine dehydrogenase [Gammaproteobacteria bacterium]